MPLAPIFLLTAFLLHECCLHTSSAESCWAFPTDGSVHDFQERQDWRLCLCFILLRPQDHYSPHQLSSQTWHPISACLLSGSLPFLRHRAWPELLCSQNKYLDLLPPATQTSLFILGALHITAQPKSETGMCSRYLWFACTVLGKGLEASRSHSFSGSTSSLKLDTPCAWLEKDWPGTPRSCEVRISWPLLL